MTHPRAVGLVVWVTIPAGRLAKRPVAAQRAVRVAPRLPWGSAAVTPRRQVCERRHVPGGIVVSWSVAGQLASASPWVTHVACSSSGRATTCRVWSRAAAGPTWITTTARFTGRQGLQSVLVPMLLSIMILSVHSGLRSSGSMPVRQQWQFGPRWRTVVGQLRPARLAASVSSRALQATLRGEVCLPCLVPRRSLWAGLSLAFQLAVPNILR